MDEQKRRERIEEYKEVGLDWRHDDQRFWQLTRLFLTLSFVVWTLPFVESKTPIWLCATAGMTLISFWYVSFRLYAHRFSIRFKRIQQIEGMLGFNYHLKYHEEMDKKRFKFNELYTVLWIAYMGLGVIVLIINYSNVG